MPTDIYEQHRAAFANVSAYVVVRDGQRVATVAFKYPRDGAGRLWAYVHWLGTEMVRGYASGGGYDKHSAACAAAAGKIAAGNDENGKPTRGVFVAEMRKNDGYYWHQNLERAGFTVWQVV